MTLTVTNEETHYLAVELARRLDVSIDEAVTIALRDKLSATEDRATVKQRLASFVLMADSLAERLTPQQRTFDIDAELYDEHGLPR